MQKITIKMPRLINNEDFVTLGCWCVENGAFVKQGQVLAVLETTKETTDLIAETDGYIFYGVSEGKEIEVGEAIAEIRDISEQNLDICHRNSVMKKEVTDLEECISKKALRLIEKYHIDLEQLPRDRIIKEKDVLKLINQDRGFVQSRANEILIVCGGNLARMCIDTLRVMGGYRLGGITDMYAKPGSLLMGVPYIGDIDILEKKYKAGYRTAINAYAGLVSSNTDELFFARKKLYERIKSYQFFMPNLIHPKATVENSATMGEGNLIFAEAYIGSEAYIGNNCIINTGSIISHNCIIGDHCKISPGAMIAGNVVIGENSIIGMGVTIYMKVKIGKNVIIYNGKSVFNDVPDDAVIK